MEENLRTENRATFATLAAAISFPYIWLGLYLFLTLLYGANFFGQGFGGGLVAGLLCLGLLNPLVPGLVSTFVARPIFLNLLGREIVSSSGCLVGLAGFALIGLATLYFLARDMTVAVVIFLAAPLVGGLLAFLISTAARSGFSLGHGRRPSAPTPPRISVSSRPSLPAPPNRPGLPGSSASTGSRLLPPRRNQPTGSSSPGRIPPPPRVRK